MGNGAASPVCTSNGKRVSGFIRPIHLFNGEPRSWVFEFEQDQWTLREAAMHLLLKDVINLLDPQRPSSSAADGFTQAPSGQSL